MSSFKKLVEMHIKSYIQYKFGFFVTCFLQPIQIFVNLALFKSIFEYNGTNTIIGYDLEQMVWYYTCINFVFVFIWNFTHTNISGKILSGDLIMDFLRPVSLFKLELSNAVGLRLCGVLLEFVPAVFIYSLIIFPTFLTAFSIIRFLIVIVFSFILYYILSFLIGLIAFSVKNNTTVIAIKEVLITALGGCFIPLDFFPGKINFILNYLPFKYIFYWPIQFFLNRGQAASFLFCGKIVCIQIVWITGFYLLSKVIWKYAAQKFCAAGG